MEQRFAIETVDTVQRWQVLAAEWDRVLRATAGYTGLQSFDFLAAWWRIFGGARKLHILAFFADGVLAGLAPLQIAERRILGKPHRALQFIGMTEDILVPRMLFPAGESAALHGALVEHLAMRSDAWDVIELDELVTGDPAAAALRTLADRYGFIHRSYPFHDCPYLDLANETEQTFWRKRSPKLLKNVRASERKLQAQGALELESFAAPDDVLRGLDALIAVAARSWKAKAGIGIAGDAAYAKFYAELLPVFARRHGARVLILKSGGKPIAGTLAIELDGAYCSLEIAHDERYDKFSPGTLLEYYELKELLRLGTVRRYEFLGGALQNKLRWTSAVRTTCCVTVAKANLHTQLHDWYQFEAKPVAKGALRRLGVRRGAGSARA